MMGHERRGRLAHGDDPEQERGFRPLDYLEHVTLLGVELRNEEPLPVCRLLLARSMILEHPRPVLVRAAVETWRRRERRERLLHVLQLIARCLVGPGRPMDHAAVIAERQKTHGTCFQFSRRTAKETVAQHTPKRRAISRTPTPSCRSSRILPTFCSVSLARPFLSPRWTRFLAIMSATLSAGVRSEEHTS